MRYLFCVDAGTSVGFGHLVRCSAIAQSLKERGHSCFGNGPPSEVLNSAQRDLFVDWVTRDVDVPPEVSARKIVESVWQNDVEMLIVDDYRVDEHYQRYFRAASINWLQFDGSATKPIFANIVVNANPLVRKQDYDAVLQHRSTELLLGPQFAVLRPEFACVEKGKLNRPVRRILVTFGGGDDRGATELVLKTLLSEVSTDVEFVVLSGKANPQNDYLQTWVQRFGLRRVELHVDPQNPSSVIASCDLAVMAGGSSIYEAAYCGIPMVIISVAENQVAQSMGWEKVGAALYVGSIRENIGPQLRKAVLRLLNEPVKIQAMREISVEKVDGLGAHRIAKRLSA